VPSSAERYLRSTSAPAAIEVAVAYSAAYVSGGGAASGDGDGWMRGIIDGASAAQARARMKIAPYKPVPVIRKLLTVAAAGLCVAVLMCGGCVYTSPSFREAVAQGIAEQIREDTKGKTFTFIFTDSAGKERAEIPAPEPNAEPNSQFILEVRCLDDNTVWKPDFKKSVDFSSRGYVSTAPVKVITSSPSSSPVTLPAAKTQGLVLVDERGRVRGVLLSQKGTDQDLLEIHPVNSTSAWRLDWGKSHSRFFGGTWTEVKQ